MWNEWCVCVELFVVRCVVYWSSACALCDYVMCLMCVMVCMRM